MSSSRLARSTCNAALMTFSKGQLHTMLRWPAISVLRFSLVVHTPSRDIAGYGSYDFIALNHLKAGIQIQIQMDFMLYGLVGL
jgi:hypothetical protein